MRFPRRRGCVAGGASSPSGPDPAAGPRSVAVDRRCWGQRTGTTTGCPVWWCRSGHPAPSRLLCHPVTAHRSTLPGRPRKFSSNGENGTYSSDSRDASGPAATESHGRYRSGPRAHHSSGSGRTGPGPGRTPPAALRADTPARAPPRAATTVRPWPHPEALLPARLSAPHRAPATTPPRNPWTPPAPGRVVRSESESARESAPGPCLLLGVRGRVWSLLGIRGRARSLLGILSAGTDVGAGVGPGCCSVFGVCRSLLGSGALGRCVAFWAAISSWAASTAAWSAITRTTTFDSPGACAAGHPGAPHRHAQMVIAVTQRPDRISPPLPHRARIGRAHPGHHRRDPARQRRGIQGRQPAPHHGHLIGILMGADPEIPGPDHLRAAPHPLRIMTLDHRVDGPHQLGFRQRPPPRAPPRRSRCRSPRSTRHRRPGGCAR